MDRAIESISLVFTSAGRRVELLRVFKAAFRSLDLDGSVIALDIDPLAPALQVADRSYIVPHLSSRDFIPTLIRICRRERAKAIFPLIDPDIPVLAAHRTELEATGVSLAVAPLEAVQIAADKWRTIEFFRMIGLSVPDSWTSVGSIPDKEICFPLFIKPRFGSAGRGAYRVTNPEELHFFSDYIPDPIIQEFLPGPEITSDVICGLDGEVLSVVSRQRIEVRWGEVAKGVTIYDKDILEGCVRVARAFRVKGPITVQCIMKEGIPHFTEINARLGGGAPLGIAAGADWPQWLISRLAGLRTEVPSLGGYRRGLYMTRFDDSFFLSKEEHDKIASSHI